MPEGGGVRPLRRRSEVEIRWRQFRHAPRPIVRAVMSSLIVALILGVGYLAYDIALTSGSELPGGDLRALFVVIDVVVVLVVGSLATWLLVPQPRGVGDQRRRTLWGAALGLFAAVPVAYLTLVFVVQVVRPLLAP